LGRIQNASSAELDNEPGKRRRMGKDFKTRIRELGDGCLGESNLSKVKASGGIYGRIWKGFSIFHEGGTKKHDSSLKISRAAAFRIPRR